MERIEPYHPRFIGFRNFFRPFCERESEIVVTSDVCVCKLRWRLRWLKTVEVEDRGYRPVPYTLSDCSAMAPDIS